MKTANFVKLQAPRSPNEVIGYNLQDKKTKGRWPFQEWNPLRQQDLVSFHGSCAVPGAPFQTPAQDIAMQGRTFIYQDVSDKDFCHYYQKTKEHKTWSSCHTIVQSFDFKANPHLTPEFVHEMGNQFYRQIGNYLRDTYNFHLNGGLVSTHIDQYGRYVNPKNKMYQKSHHLSSAGLHRKAPHLHNHIIVPNYNAEGESIARYLRSYDIYRLHQIDDAITANQQYDVIIPFNKNKDIPVNDLRQKRFKINNYYKNGLRYSRYDVDDRQPGIYHEHFKDYYFDKLHQQINPVSVYTKNYSKSSGESATQKASRMFSEANDYAWDKCTSEHNLSKMKPRQEFSLLRSDRDNYLKQNFNYSVKHKKDKMTNRTNIVFHLKGFHKWIKDKEATKLTHHTQYEPIPQKMYCNLNTMKTLKWGNLSDIRTERFIRQLDFNKNKIYGRSVSKIPMTYRTYQKSIAMAVTVLPKIQTINTPQKRRNHQVDMSKIYSRLAKQQRADLMNNIRNNNYNARMSLGKRKERLRRAYYHNKIRLLFADKLYEFNSKRNYHDVYKHNFIVSDTAKTVKYAPRYKKAYRRILHKNRIQNTRRVPITQQNNKRKLHNSISHNDRDISR